LKALSNTLSCLFIHRTPAGSGSLSEESDHYEKNHCLSNGDCYQSFDDDNADFNISYHKANQTSDEYLSCETTHISELHAVPGFTFVFKESAPLQKTEDENPFLQVTDDDNLSIDFSVGMIKGKHLKKTMSHPSNGTAGGQTFGNDVKPEKAYCRSGSLPNGTFLTVSDISLRTQPSELPPPSRPPPLADVKMGDSISLTSNGKCIDSEGTAGDSSPPIFDVEVDASSSAAASAAAMKEAMKKAQAKLRSAKELMDRKKEGFQGSAKMSSKNHVLDREEKESKIVDECAIFRDDSEEGACYREGNREERQKVRKKAQEVPDSIEEEKLPKVTKKSAEKKLGQESCSSLRSDKIDGDSEWKEASQFFELVRTAESGKAFQQTNQVHISEHNTQMHERGQKETKATLGVFGQKEEDNKNVKSARGNHELEYEKRSKVAKEACEQEENNGRSKTVKESHRQKEHEKKVKVAREVFEQVENEKKVRVAQKRLETEKKSIGADVSENCDNLAEFQWKENKFEVEQAMKHKENELKLKKANKRMEGEKRHKESCEREGNEKRKIEAFKQEENEKKLKEALGRVEDEKKLKEALEQKESEKRLKEEVIERDENEKKQKEACKRQEDEKELREDLEQEENKKQLQKVLEQEEREKRLKETLEWKEDEKKQKEFHKREENEKRLEQALEREENEKKQQEAYERNENEKRLNVACEIEEEKSLYGTSEQEDGSGNLKRAHERKEHDGRSKEGFEQEETEKTAKEASIWEETEKRLKDAGGKEELKGLNKLHEQTERDKTGKKLKLAKQTFLRVEEEDLRVSDGAFELEDSENLQTPNLTCTNHKNSGKMEKTEDALAHEENGTTKSEPKDKEKDPEAVEIANVLVGEKCKASDVAQGDLGLEENRFRMDEKKSLPIDDNVKKAGAPSIGVGQTQTCRSKSLSQLDSDPINQERKFAHEWGERGNNIKQTQAVLDQEESKDRVMSTHVKKDWVESGRKIEAARPAMSEAKGNIQKTSPRVNVRQVTERKEKNINEEKEMERTKRERELEMDRLRKIEEEREREREREKDRMAVDRATLEARERAYTEAREKADRAAVDRAMAEARERLEKACAEAREKSFAEKATMEAKLRAERAAIERATAEARERVVERVMAEKAAFGTRERMERSVSDKYSASFRNSEMKQSSSSLVYGGM
jgi:hypothetical protein